MATAKKSPHAAMKDKHGDKETLVDRVLGVLHLGDADKEKTKAKLLAASNKKLLRLLEVATTVKDKYGSPDGLAQAAAKALGKTKDQAYVARLAALAKSTPARVLDLLRAAEKRAKAA